MIATIKYRNPKRPDEAGMVFICDLTQMEQTKARLAKQGFIVVNEAEPPPPPPKPGATV